jgi:3-methyladenine DNA glycosylase AlkD
LVAEEVLKELRAQADPAAVAGMARFGIRSANALGVSTPKLRALAKRIGRDQPLAIELWRTGILEARGVAGLIGDAAAVTEALMESWVAGFDSWAVCDGCCCNLFDKTRFAWRKAIEWSRRDEEFVKRAGYVLMAALAVHDKPAPDEKFLRFLPALRRGASDERNFVRKAVNWALRQIGKRNRKLNREAIRIAREIRAIGTPAARWIAADALRELQSDAVQRRLARPLRSHIPS